MEKAIMDQEIILCRLTSHSEAVLQGNADHCTGLTHRGANRRCRIPSSRSFSAITTHGRVHFDNSSEEELQRCMASKMSQ